MKKIRFSFVILFACLTAFAFNSCDDDGYDLGNFVISLATVNPIDEQAGTYYLTMDNGTTLWPAASNVYYKPKQDQRVWVDFTVLSDSTKGYDHLVRINRIQEILTKEVIDLTSENESEIGNDPIKILDYWIGDNYLNIHFGYNVGGEKSHLVNMVQNKLTDITQNEDGTIVLELRHNANEDPERYGAKGYAAFDIKKFQQSGKDSVDFLIKVQDFNNEEKEYTITYKYKSTDKDLTKNKTITNMPDNTRIN